MTTHLLNPSYVKILYHSVFAQHSMSIPTRPWSAADGGSGNGSYIAWDDSTADPEAMITALVEDIVGVLHSSVIFDTWWIYNELSVGGQLVPVKSGVFTSLEGTEATPGWYEAVQGIFTFYDTGFNTAKLSILEFASKNNFARRDYGTLSVPELAIANEFMADGNAWSSRAGLQPVTLRSLSLGINDALKKQYPTI